MIVSGRVCRQAIRRGFLFGPLHITLLFLLSANPGNAATWTKMLNVMPGGNTVQLMVQMTDGSILVQGYNGFTWMKLTPDATGNYINGTWSTLAQGPTPRIYFASQVLPDGRFWLVGGNIPGPAYLQTGRTPVRFTIRSRIAGPRSRLTPAKPIVLPSAMYLGVGQVGATKLLRFTLTPPVSWWDGR